MHEAATMSGTPIMKCLLKGIEDETCMCCPARSPSNDATGEDVDHEGHVDEALPGGDRGGSVCLNSSGRFAKWISASIMPPPSLVSAR